MKPLNGFLRIQQAGFLAALILMVILSGCSPDQASFGVGQPAPDFSLPTADGGTVALDDFVGQQPVLLYFHMAVG